MKNLSVILLFLFITINGFSQVAKSFYYNGYLPNRSGSYIEKNTGNDTYFITQSRRYDSYIETVLSNVDEFGNTNWHSVIEHYDIPSNSFTVATDVTTSNSNVFVSTFLDESILADKHVNIYKFDLNGLLIDSVELVTLYGIQRKQSNEISIDNNGNLITLLKNNNNELVFFKVDVNSMTIINEQVIGLNSLGGWHSRALFSETDNTNTYVAYNVADSAKFTVLDNSSGITNTFNIPTVGGRMVDFEIFNSEIYILVNANPNSGVNPLRIIRTTIGGVVISDDNYTVQNDVSYENFTIDANGDIFICSISQYYAGIQGKGGIVKLVGNTVAYEYVNQNANFFEVELNGNNIFLAGTYSGGFSHCSSPYGNLGGLFVKNNKSDIFSSDIIAPHMTFNANNISLVVASTSINFNNSAVSLAGYSVAGSGSTIYNSSLILSGVDLNSNIKGSNSQFQNFYASGPITNSVDYTKKERDQWDRVWIVSKNQIDNHILAFQNLTVGYEIPEVIKNWPGNGDVSIGQTEKIARFKDINNNGIYEPNLGEYPLIKGDYCALSIYNDINTPFDTTCINQNNKGQVQILEYTYTFDCVQDSSIQNSTFVYYEIVNHLGEAISDTRIGHMLDFDINSPADDYIGSDPLRSIIYAFNGSNVVGPEQAYLILGSSQDDNGLDDNIGIASGESPNGYGYANGIVDDERLGMTNSMFQTNIFGLSNPNSVQDYYNFMQSIYTDGSHLVYGGNGYPGSVGATNITANFVMPNNSDNLFYGTNGVDPGMAWSEATVGNTPGDRRAMGSSGPFIFEDTLFFDVCFVSGMKNLATGDDSHTVMIENVDSIRNYFANNETSCGDNFDFYQPFNGPYPSDGVTEYIEEVIKLYPNPTSSSFLIDGVNIGANIYVFSANGQLVYKTIASSQKVEIDLMEKKGIYLITIQTDLKYHHIRVVVQ